MMCLVATGYLTALFNRKTEAQDIQYVTQNIQVDKENRLDTARINGVYKIFDERYKQEIKKCLDEGLGDAYLVPIIRKKVDSLRIQHATGQMMWTAEMKTAAPELVALIFAVWTLHHSKKFLANMDASDKSAYLFQPHPVQVVAIFCLLGIDSGGVGLERSLIQVRTGEGKSAVLGVSSSLLALYKCRVSVACYSEYLSQRDGDNIAFLFNALGVLDDVKYMTLTKVCEYEINKTVNIREALEGIIMGGGAGAAAGGVKGEWKPRVLLVDEVDVFFTKSFYGSTYLPACELRHETISNLLREVYTKKPATLEAVKDWQVYKDVCLRLQTWEFLVDTAVCSMLGGMECFAEHAAESQYVVKDDAIGYREQDSIVFNVSYGYLTLIAYLKENQAGNISEHSLTKNLKLLVECGEFLFAKLPQDFDLVMGVTGTLETMSPAEKRIVKEDYHIKRMVYMPSVYGQNQVVEKLIAVEESEEGFLATLMAEIEEAKAARAVVVFFDSTQGLREFAKHPCFSKHVDESNLLLEEIYPEEKSQIVTCRAATMNAVTLASSTFGRGTDFQCMDDTVQQAGGIHIIQTHVADTLSEEIQIKGRTARQGEKGSWSMVLRKPCLLKTYAVDEQALSNIMAAGRNDESRKAMWNLINDKRMHLNMAQLEELISFVAENEVTHQQAVSFSSALLTKNVVDVRKYLEHRNRPAASMGMEGKARILVLMDATGSMSQIITAAKDAVGEMFGRAGEILDEHLGKGTDKFEMQFAVFRNYSSGPAKLLEFSPWKSNPDDLRDFLKATSASGGQGNEAIEIGFWHANQQADVKRIILIGDAPGNEDAEVSKKRHGYGEARFLSTNYQQPTTVNTEMDKLIAKKIPVDCFFVNTRCQAAFEKMAKATDGKAFPLVVSKVEGRELLIGHITTSILLHVGGEGKGDELVNAYTKKFGKMHS